MPINPQDLGRLLKPDNRAWSNLHGAILTHANGWVLRVLEVNFRPPYCSLNSQIINGEPKVHNFNTEALAKGAFVAIELDASREDVLVKALGVARAAHHQAQADQVERDEQRKLEKVSAREKYLAQVRDEERAANAAVAAAARAEEERLNRERENSEREQAERANRVEDWKRCVHERGIERLTHVTRIQNLASILHHGLLPVDRFGELAGDPVRNDAERIDGLRNAVSLSVTHPNDPLFEKWHTYKYAVDTWVVLSINPSVMWELPCALFYSNAATAWGSGNVAASLQPFATDFEKLFVEPSIGASRASHSAADTTNPQAEVMIVGTIRPGYIEAVYVRDAGAFDLVRPIVKENWKPDGPLRIEPSLFTMRPCAKAFGDAQRKAKALAAASQMASAQSSNGFDDDIPF